MKNNNNNNSNNNDSNNNNNNNNNVTLSKAKLVQGENILYELSAKAKIISTKGKFFVR